MKKYFIILMLTSSLFVSAQEANKWQLNQSKKISSYVLEKIELEPEDAEYFKKVQLDQMIQNANEIKASGATSQEDKKKIYATGRLNLKNKLVERFGKKIAQSLMNAINESRKQ